MSAEPGRLSVVGTPIGNLGDLSIRAANVLLNADAIVCEDTRRTGKLLAHIRQLSADAQPAPSSVDHHSDERADLLVANEHTEFSRIPEILDRIGRGQSLALVSDAGMPTVSDPGKAVVSAVAQAGFPLEVIPGPTAVSAGLAVSGLPADRYVFEGFLPRKGTERRHRLAALAIEVRTVVLYEAPHRLLKTLGDLSDACGGDRPVVVARELTKLYEEADHSSIADAVKRFGSEPPRGEFVLILAGAPSDKMEVTEAELITLIDHELAAGATTRDAVTAVAADTGVRKRKVYTLATARAALVSERTADAES